MIRSIENLILIEQDQDLFVVVPAEDVLLTEVSLPKMNRERLQKALPFALEEQLIADLTSYHFAIGERDAENHLPVAVVAKDKMQHWINLLNAHDLSPTHMIPATLALPFQENTWQVYSLENKLTLIRTGKFSGAAIDAAHLNDFIPSPAHTIELTQAEFEKQLQMGLTSTPHINLLQGHFSPKRKKSNIPHQWKWASIAAVAWLGIVLSHHLISFFLLQHEENKLNQSLLAIYHQQFPQATSINAPKERMEQKLKEMIAASAKNNFLSLLATVTKATSETSGIRLQNLVYANNTLNLTISASTFDALDMLTNHLTEQGLTVKQQNAGTVGAEVKATLLITAGNA